MNQEVEKELLPEKMKLIHFSHIEGINCKDVAEDEVEEVYALAEEMVKFCHEKQGIGLAAPQIGVFKKFFIWLDGDKWSLAINPMVFPEDRNKISLMERCLSYPKKYFKVKRFKRITAVFYNIDGKTGKLKKYSRRLSGDRAWVFQHEFDHLYGKTVATEGEDMTPVKQPKKISEKVKSDNSNSTKNEITGSIENSTTENYEFKGSEKTNNG